MDSAAKLFLQQTAPFSDLSSTEIDRILEHIQVKLFSKGTKVCAQGGSPAQHLLIIRTGSIRVYVEQPDGGESLVEYFRPGETFGVVSLIDGKASPVSGETVEDTECLLLDKEEFWRLFLTHATFSEYFSKSLAKRLKDTLDAVKRDTSANADRVAGEVRTGLDISSLRVRSLISKVIVSCSPSTCIHDAARKMVDNSVGSILVLENEYPVGIVTDTDLRRAIALSFQGAVGEIMSKPVITISVDALAFEAIYEMLRHGIHHIVVVEEGHPIGVVSNSDLLAAHADSPLFLAREIGRANSYSELASVPAKTEAIIAALIERGVGAYNLGRITAEMNDRLVQRIISLVEIELSRGLGLPPVPYCWLGLGSEGRREQTVKTDQDNALVYRDPPKDRARETQAYFQLLASRVVEELVNCGFPPCKGGVMASNPRWCQPLSVWKKYFSTWVRDSEDSNLLNATIFFDFRPIWGDTELATELHEHLYHEVEMWKAFVGKLARMAVDHRPPLGFFRNIVLEKAGDHKGTIDLKRRGLLPLVDAIRVYSLEHTVMTSNTFERIRALREKGVFSDGEAAEIAGAYEFIMLLRIRNQIEQIKAGQKPDNFLNPDKLTRSEKNMLKDYFVAISNLQDYLQSHFLTWFIS